PIGLTVADLTAPPTGYNNPTVTFTITSAQDFVFSVLSTHDGEGPGTLTVTGPGGATASITNTTTLVGMYFFEMKGFQAGDTLTLTATASTSTSGKFSAVAFDTAGGFASWQTTNGTSQGLDGDHDHDGVPNGIEYFLGGNTNTTGFTPLPGVNKALDGTLSITWTKATDYPGTYGTDFVVETSEALTGDWAPEVRGGKVTITGNEVKYTFPSPLGAKKFVRLKVTGP
ncbi:MAG: hypothetical protein NTW21_35780, partial [Verrucomicrobia bacterium]|nr:hypothetical protein [Verrucomicrobiota bacterium]